MTFLSNLRVIKKKLIGFYEHIERSINEHISDLFDRGSDDVSWIKFVKEKNVSRIGWRKNKNGSISYE